MLPHLAKRDPPPALSPRAKTVDGLPGRWEIIQCFTNHEAKVAWRLLESGIGYCLPMERVRKFKDGKRLDMRRVLWPGYVFACAEDVPQMRWDFDRRREPSVIGFITEPNQPRLIHELSALQYAMNHDAGNVSRKVVKGVRCEIEEGPYMGFEGVIDRITGKGYAVLTIDTLGQCGVSIEVPVECLSVRSAAVA